MAYLLDTHTFYGLWVEIISCLLLLKKNYLILVNPVS
jgi:hypothetical protein